MKVEVSEHGGLVLKEVYKGVMFETKEGEKLSVCMRDGGFEIGIFMDGVTKWYSINNGKMFFLYDGTLF